MEALTNYQLSHAEAVAVGLTLDTIYSQKIGFLSKENAERIIKVLQELGLKTYHPALDWTDAKGNRRVLAGLDEFREHLGGELTVLLLSDLGKGVDVHEFNTNILEQSIEQLREMWELAAH
jgi:3-dehydroquinate synthase